MISIARSKEGTFSREYFLEVEDLSFAMSYLKGWRQANSRGFRPKLAPSLDPDDEASELELVLMGGVEFRLDRSGRFQCGTSDHLTQQNYENVRAEMVARIENYNPVPEFLRSNLNHFFVTGEFADRVRGTNLRGAEFLSCEGYGWFNGKKPKRNFDLRAFMMQFAGRNCVRVPRVLDRQNVCLYCGEHPILCEQCGFTTYRCPKTYGLLDLNERIYLEEKDRPDASKALVSEYYLGPDEIVDGSRWDGSDFFCSHVRSFISRRAFDWLEQIHAGPLTAVPVRFCIDGLSDKQKKWLDEIGDVNSITEK